MTTRNAPNVVEYNHTSYDPYRPNSLPPQQSQTVQPGYQQDPRYPVPQQNYQVRPTNDARGGNYDQYKKRVSEYKYNIYSLIDEPWNRLCEVGKCGTCPGNECIARRAPKLDWI